MGVVDFVTLYGGITRIIEVDDVFGPGFIKSIDITISYDGGT